MPHIPSVYRATYCTWPRNKCGLRKVVFSAREDCGDQSAFCFVKFGFVEFGTCSAREVACRSTCTVREPLLASLFETTYCRKHNNMAPTEHNDCSTNVSPNRDLTSQNRLHIWLFPVTKLGHSRTGRVGVSKKVFDKYGYKTDTALNMPPHHSQTCELREVREYSLR